MMQKVVKKICFIAFIVLCLTHKIFCSTGVSRYLTHENNAITNISDNPSACAALSVVKGGTGLCALTAHYLLVGNGTSAITLVAPSATVGNPLVSQGVAADPIYSATPSVTSITISNTPVSGTDGANKAYVDFVAAGLNIQAACVAATTAALTVTYANGTAGVGATLTNAGAQAAFSIDGQSPTVGQRVLIKDQASTFQNGIYTVTTVGNGSTNWVLTRATDFNAPGNISPGDLVPVDYGSVNASTMWLETATVTTVGTDPILFSQFLKQGSVFSTTTTLTTAQVQALNATPITVVTAPASGNVIYVINAMLKNNFVTAAFASATGTIDLIYTGLSGSPIITGLGSNAFVAAGAINVMGGINGGQTNLAYSSVNGVGVQVSNPGAAFTAGGTSTITVVVNYSILTI